MMIGNKRNAEAADERWMRPTFVVGERSSQRRSRTVTSGGATTSDNAGMSNDKPGENPGRRKPKVSWGR